MNKRRKYIGPQSIIISLEECSMLATSDLKYTDEEADKDLEILSRDWDEDRNETNVWKEW